MPPEIYYSRSTLDASLDDDDDLFYWIKFNFLCYIADYRFFVYTLKV